MSAWASASLAAKSRGKGRDLRHSCERRSALGPLRERVGSPRLEATRQGSDGSDNPQAEPTNNSGL